MNRYKHSMLVLLVMLAVAACRGSDSNTPNPGYSGATGSARITSSNGGQLTVAAVSGIRGALADASIPNSIPGSGARPAGIDWSRLAARSARKTVPNACSSGSVDVTDTTGGGTTGTVTIVFHHCTATTQQGETATLDGTMVFVNHADGSFMISIDQMSVTASWGSQTIVHYAMSCDAAFNCNWTLDARGMDGRIYRTENANIGPQAGGGVSGTLTVYHPDHGKVEVVASGLLFDCPTGAPSAGRIVLTDATGQTVTVTFNGCNGFTVMFNGVATPYLWRDLLG